MTMLQQVRTERCERKLSAMEQLGVCIQEMAWRCLVGRGWARWKQVGQAEVGTMAKGIFL